MASNMHNQSTQLIADLFRLFFQGRYHTSSEAKITPRIVQEYTSLTEEEGSQLSQCRNTLHASFPETQNQPTTLMDLACLASLVDKSSHLQNTRLLPWLAQRIRGFNKELQSNAVSYLNWEIGALHVFSRLPREVLILFKQEPPRVGTDDENEHPTKLLQIASLATTNPVQLSSWNESVARLSSSQVEGMLDFSLDFLKQNADVAFIAVFEPLMECCIENHLDEVQRRLFDIGSYPPYIRVKGGFHFIQAEAKTRDNLISQLRSTNDLDGLLKALAWIGDDVAAETFAKLDKQTWWKSQLHCKPSSYSLHAGWYLGPTGERIKLCNAESYRLTEITVESVKPAYTFGIHSEMTCRQCGTQMIVVLEPAIIKKYLGLEIESHKQVLWCPQCWESTMIDWEDRSSYEVDRLSTKSSTYDQPQVNFQIEPQQVNAVPDWYSKFGGHPYWLQDEAYPHCSHCSNLMFFLAQIDDGHAMVYAFICLDCHVCASVAQCT